MLSGFIVTKLPWFAVAGALAYLPYFFYSNYHYGKQTPLNHFIKYALIVYGLSLIYATILWYYPYISLSPDHYFINLHPFIWLHESYTMGAEKMMGHHMLNIGMYVPFGLLLSMAIERIRKLWRVFAVVLCVSVITETLQYFIGRSADIDDTIMNTAGGVLGYYVFMLLNRVFSKEEWWKNMIERKLLLE